MKELAFVIDANEDTAVVEVARSSACSGCGKCMIGRENQTVQAEIKNTRGVKTGDTVEVEMEFSSILSASFIAYGIPFIGFIIGAVLGYYVLSKIVMFSADILGLISGLVFIVLTYIGIKLLDKKGLFKENFTMEMAKE